MTSRKRIRCTSRLAAHDALILPGSINRLSDAWLCARAQTGVSSADMPFSSSGYAAPMPHTPQPGAHAAPRDYPLFHHGAPAAGYGGLADPTLASNPIPTATASLAGLPNGGVGAGAFSGGGGPTGALHFGGGLQFGSLAPEDAAVGDSAGLPNPNPSPAASAAGAVGGGLDAPAVAQHAGVRAGVHAHAGGHANAGGHASAGGHGARAQQQAAPAPPVSLPQVRETLRWAVAGLEVPLALLCSLRVCPFALVRLC